MIIAAIALMSSPPPVFRPVTAEPVVGPEMPWDNQAYELQCEVLDAALHRGRLNVTLTDRGTARISGDKRHSLNNDRFVLSNLSYPDAPPPATMWRTVSFDAGNGTYVAVTQAFINDVLQTTSFVARHTRDSNGVPNTEQVLGFCVPASKADEVDQ